jgi:hypothetical protein
VALVLGDETADVVAARPPDVSDGDDDQAMRPGEVADILGMKGNSVVTDQLGDHSYRSLLG